MTGRTLLAAGKSQRVSRPKLALPWCCGRPILVRLVDLLLQAHIDPIAVVTGADREQIEDCLEESPFLLV